MLRYILCLTVLFGFAAHARPIETQSLWDVVSIDLREVQDSGEPIRLVENDCTKMPTDDAGSIDWGTVITVGEKIWKIVEANKPVVVVTTPEAFALPRGLSCWSDLDGWKVPVTRSFEVAYKNLFGIEVTKFRFRLHYTYGGGHSGVGRYLANVTVIPAELNVVWGYNFNAQVEVEQAVNLGSKENPMAGLELNLKWTIKTVAKESVNSFHFFVQGDGQLSTAE